MLGLQCEGKILDSRFIPSFCINKASKLCAIGSKTDAEVKQSDTKIWHAERILDCIPCKECGKIKVVYARAICICLMNTKEIIIEKIEAYRKHRPYLCGFKIINDQQHECFNKVTWKCVLWIPNPNILLQWAGAEVHVPISLSPLWYTRRCKRESSCD